MKSSGPDRPAPDEESPDEEEQLTPHLPEVPEEPARPAPDEEEDEEREQTFHSADVPDEEEAD
jgi:hypothetical protein